MKRLLMIAPLLLLAGCQVITDQQTADIVLSAKQADADVLANMPAGKPRDAIQHNVEAIGTTLGQPFTMTAPVTTTTK